MALTRILFWLGNTLILMAGLMVLTAILAIAALETQEATNLGIAAIVASLVGGMFVLATQNTPSQERNQDALYFLFLFWIIIPLFGALPFLFLGSTDNLLTAWFEAVSAFTTTGSSTLIPEDQSRALLIWRSILAAFGGVASATLAVVILASLNLAGTGVHRSMLFTLKKGALFGRLVAIGRIVALIYGLIALSGFVVMSAAGARPFDAFCLALSGVATAGLGTQSVPLAEYIGFRPAVVLAIVCMLGAASVAVHWDVLRLRNLREAKNFFRNAEHRALFGLAFGLGLIGFSYTGFRHFTTVSLEATYLVSSAGFDYNVIGLELLPPSVLIAVALIGGAALSTAGGLKLIRLLLLMRHMRIDIERLSHPSRVKPVRFRGRHIPDSAFLSVWMYFLGYSIVFGVGIITFSALGLPFDVAVPAAAGAISNVGPLIDINMVTMNWADFSAAQLLTSGLLMIIGRVEVLAILAVITSALAKA